MTGWKAKKKLKWVFYVIEFVRFVKQFVAFLHFFAFFLFDCVLKIWKNHWKICGGSRKATIIHRPWAWEKVIKFRFLQTTRISSLFFGCFWVFLFRHFGQIPLKIKEISCFVFCILYTEEEGQLSFGKNVVVMQWLDKIYVRQQNIERVL